MVEMMDKMGYDDENGWLRKLLLTVDGDIERAVAVINREKNEEDEKNKM